jgi:hypothetical protein
MALKISLQELQDNLFSCSIWLGYENYNLLKSQTKIRVLISRERLWEPQNKNISFQCRPNARNYKIYYKNVMPHLKFKLWWKNVFYE